MIILVKRGQKLRSGARWVYFWIPKSLLRLPHLWKLLNFLAKFPELMFLQFYVPMIIFVKRSKNCVGDKGVAFLTPKSLLRHLHLWEQLNIFVKLSRTHVSLVYVPMIIVFERGAKMTPPV